MFDDQFFGSPGFRSGFGDIGMGFGGGISSKFGFDNEPPQMKGTGFGLSRSVSTTTKTINGKTVTTKKTTIFNEDGSQ